MHPHAAAGRKAHPEGASGEGLLGPVEEQVRPGSCLASGLSLSWVLASPYGRWGKLSALLISQGRQDTGDSSGGSYCILDAVSGLLTHAVKPLS